MRHRVIGNCAVTRVLVILALGLVFGVAAGIARAGITERVSVASDGTEGDGNSEDPRISADGRFVAFRSYATNLVPDDTNARYDIFVHDRQTGQTTRVSVASDGTQGNDDPYVPSLSADGRFVAFESSATNLVPGDTNGTWDIFVHDQSGGTLTVTTSGNGTGAVELSPPGGVYAPGTTVTLTPQPSRQLLRPLGRRSGRLRQPGDHTDGRLQERCRAFHLSSTDRVVGAHC